MSQYVKMRCGNCKGIFDIYFKRMKENKPAGCPFCNKKIPVAKWEELMECFNRIEAWNKTVKSSADQEAANFTAEIRTYIVPSGLFCREDNSFTIRREKNA